MRDIHFSKLRLGTKAVIAAVVILFSISVLITILFFSFYKQSLVDELKVRSISLGRNLAFNSSFPLVAKDMGALRTLMSGVAREKDIESVTIATANGGILVSTDSSAIKGRIGIMPTQTNNNDSYIIEDKSALAVIIPINEERRSHTDESSLLLPMDNNNNVFELVGYVHIVVSLENVNKTFSKQLWKVIALVSIIIVTGGILTSISVQKVVGPLTELARVAKEISKGEYGKTIRTERQDEIGFLADAFNDMSTQLKQSKEDYETLNRNLEERVSHSTRELNEKYIELQRTFSSLKKKDLNKDEYLAFISHEIRNPMSTIQLYSEMMLMDSSSTEAKRKDFLNTVINNCQRLTRMLNDVLDCLKIESGQMSFRQENFNLANLVKEVISSFEPNLSSKGIRCQLDSINESLPLCSDRDKIYQVLSNIMLNAIKYSREEGVIIVALSEDNDCVVVRIEDNGVGIKKEDVANVFKRFTTIPSDVNGNWGSGLGLSITKAIVEQLGGKISLESTWGKGTIVTVCLEKCKIQLQQHDN